MNGDNEINKKLKKAGRVMNEAGKIPKYKVIIRTTEGGPDFYDT